MPTVKELKSILKQAGFTRYSTLRKAELEKLVNQLQDNNHEHLLHKLNKQKHTREHNKFLFDLADKRFQRSAMQKQRQEILARELPKRRIFKKQRDVATIKANIAKIRKIVDKQGAFGFYLLADNEVKLVAKGHNLNDLMVEVLEKLSGKSQYINSPIYLVEVYIDEKYVEKPHKLVVGPVHLKIRQFKLTKKYTLGIEAGFKNGAVWYTNEDILNNGFRFTDTKQLVNKIHTRDIVIVNAGQVRALKILGTSQL